MIKQPGHEPILDTADLLRLYFEAAKDAIYDYEGAYVRGWSEDQALDDLTARVRAFASRHGLPDPSDPAPHAERPDGRKEA